MQIRKFFVLKLYVIIIVLIIEINGDEKCKYRCVDPEGTLPERSHIMCTREKSCHQVAERCSNYIEKSLGFNEKEKLKMLKLHNELRNKIALGVGKPNLPAASNMRKLIWSETLANITQCYVNACPHKYKLDFCLDLNDYKVVTNEANSPFSNHLENWVSSWFREEYNFKDIYSNYYEASFPQLIWAETQFIGCGKITYFSGPFATKMIFVACSYLPGGKINGLRIYRKGIAATNCPDNTQVDDQYKGLCSSKIVKYSFLEKTQQRHERRMFDSNIKTNNNTHAEYDQKKRIGHKSQSSMKKEERLVAPNNEKIVNKENKENKINPRKAAVVANGTEATNGAEHSTARVHGFVIVLLCLPILNLIL